MVPLILIFLSVLVFQAVLVPTMQETQVRSLGREDLLEKEIATHSSTLAWKIPWTKEPGRLQSMGLQRVGHDLVTKQQQQYPHKYYLSHFIHSFPHPDFY